jgi:uncharacterized protein (DUF2236 family)
MSGAPSRLADIVAARARGEREGLFGPGVTWTIMRETALLFGGPRALLLQLAHPAVAAAIDRHSAIRSDPIGRSARTFASVYALCFGDLETALGVVRAVERRHTVVVGTTDRDEPYRALDPRLLRWVHATLLDTTEFIFRTFVRPLTADERAAFHEDSKLVQIAFGVPPDEVTPSPAAFDAYVAAVLASDELRVTAHAAAQWEMLRTQNPSNALLGAFLLPATSRLRVAMDAPPSRVFFPALLRLFAAGTLPERVRDAYGLRWTVADRAAFASAVAAIRAGYTLLPESVRYHRAYREAMARVGA